MTIRLLSFLIDMLCFLAVAWAVGIATDSAWLAAGAGILVNAYGFWNFVLYDLWTLKR